MERVVNYIRNHSSLDEPISNKEIGDALKLSGFSIRKKINEARCQGFPICSCDKGYYYSEDKTEIIKTVQSLMHRTMAVEKAVSGLLAVVKFDLEEKEI